MKFNTRQYWLAAGLAMGIAASSATAQVAPPPTEPAKEEPKYEAPEKATPETAQPQQQRPAATINRADPSTRTQSLPTDTPYPKLAVKGDDGKIIRLTELPDILALRSNPTVGPKSVESIMPVLYGRRARFERMVIDNLDLYWMVTDGRLDELNLNNMQELAQITEMIKPLVGLTSLSKELRNRGILTRTQGGMNEHIVNEYKQAISAEIQFGSDEPMGEIMKFILEDSIHETSQAYNALIAETSTKAATLVKELQLTSPAAMELAELERPLNEDPETQRAELAEFEEAFRMLTYEEGIEVLTAMRNKRKNADYSPFVHEINVLHSRKLDISDMDTFEGTIEYNDGRKFTTKELREKHEARVKEETEQMQKEKAGKATESDG